jgi:hypothetical protein
VDETFLQRMMLVFMDLATGYLLMEEVAADRSFATWFDRANKRLTTFGTEVSAYTKLILYFSPKFLMISSTYWTR